MLQEPLTLYKLIVLYMLNRVSFPPHHGSGQRLYSGEGIYQLPDAAAGHRRAHRRRHDRDSFRGKPHPSGSHKGRQRYPELFENRINSSIRGEIDAYLRENEFTLRNEVSVQGDYYKSTSGEYEAHLIAKDREIKLVEITLSVPSKETAAAICDSWQEKNQQIYKYLVEQLF